MLFKFSSSLKHEDWDEFSVMVDLDRIAGHAGDVARD